MINQSETVVVILWKEKWKEVLNKCSINESILRLLNHDAIPCVTGHVIKKSFDRVTMKW